ncbi:oxidoreductase FAD/NAD(P)-binding domain protein [Isosphaera pallida ATCC 43644]|uniref:Ferredoxin--NADP reductase n=2 Tax=Isosphaera pallida TaxID=128 RepID=E8QYX6_ISOPI|nr:oxidoreductase FAD/NAD(P)-binding domain protein [Isosphaera pallida ATCC 43644]
MVDHDGAVHHNERVGATRWGVASSPTERLVPLESTSAMSSSAARMPARETIPFNLYKINKPGVARVVSTTQLNPGSPNDEARHIVLSLEGLTYPYLEGQSMGVLPPGLDENGKPHKLRLYSIASTRNGDDGRGATASLCVKRDITRVPETGAVHYGVASNYLCDLKPGDLVKITGPVGKVFLLPEDPEANLVMVATGTGIAPFRGFLKHLYEERRDWKGRTVLFFGVRTRLDYLYGNELEAMRHHPGFELYTAFSREQTNAKGGRMYVQDRMAEQAELLYDLLHRPNTYLYICGLKGMEDGIDTALEEHWARVGGNWTDHREKLLDDHRMHIETY